MKVIGQVKPIFVYLLVSLSTLSETIYAAALPDIALRLNTSGGIVQLSSMTYYLGFALGIFTLGRISDVRGRRPVVLVGVSLYCIMAVLLSYTNNIETFILFRFLQAYGASVGSVIGQAMMRDSYQGWELSYRYASVAMIMAVVPSIGSAIGGYIMEYGRWELVFQFLAVLSFCLTIIYALLLPETNAYSGVARNNRFISVLKVAIKDKVLVSYAFIIGCFNGLCFGFYIQAPFILIDNLGMSPASYGSLFLMLSISSLLGSIVNRNLIKKYVSTFKIISSGFAISIISCICLLIGASYIDDSSDITLVSLVIFLPMSTHLMGHSMVVPMLLRHALEDYFKVTGSAGSIFGSLYYIMTALVILCISQLHSDTIDNYSYIYAVLMVLSSIVFYLSTSWKKQSVKPEF